MATIERDNSMKRMITDENVAPKLKRSKSSWEKEADACERYGEFLEAWKAGRFNRDVSHNPLASAAHNTDKDIEEAIEEFFHPDAVLDVASTGGHTGFHAFKSYYGKRGLDTIKDWFAFVDEFTPEGMELAFVAGPKSGEVLSTYETSRSTCKTTGKGVAASIVFISKWEDSRCRKITVAYANASAVAAVCSFLDVPIPTPISLPHFDPHPDPKAAWEVVSQLWANGGFSGDAKTKQQAFDKWVAADFVLDATIALLPDVFKVYRRHDGFDAWVNDVVGEWEMTNLDMSAVAGLKPGCVLQRLTADIKHKTTGKAAKGVQMFVELAYNADGKVVYVKHFPLKPEGLVAIY